MHYSELDDYLRTWSPSLQMGERLVALRALIRYWHGEPISAPPPVAAPFPLPPALACVHSEIQARRPRLPDQPSWLDGLPVFGFFSLPHPERLEADEAGFYPFLLEPQGVFRCGARVGDEDGPVSRQDIDSTAWAPCAARLSDFLLWAIVSELITGREEMVWGAFTPEAAAQVTAPLIHVALEGVSTYGVPHEVFHGEGFALIQSANSPGDLCLEAVARDEATFHWLQEAAAWCTE